MWVKLKQMLLNSNLVEVIKVDRDRCNVYFSGQIGTSVRMPYNTEEDCEKVISLIADAISSGNPLFEMPTQEQLDSGEANSDPLIKTFKGGSQVQNGSASVKKAIELWNSLEQYGFKPVSRISNSSKRYKSLAARLREYSIEEYEKAIENIKKSELLRKNADGWFNFDWFISLNNFPKVLDGNYNSATDRIGEEEKGWWED